MALAVGIDPDRHSLVEYRVPAVCRVTGLAERLPFADGEFDLVICSWVLEHLVQPQRAFQEIARVLQSPDPSAGRPGGRLVFLTPNAWHPLIWINRVLGHFGDWQQRLVMRFFGRAEENTFPVVYRANTPRRIAQLARASGLVPATLFTVGDPTYLAFNEPFYRLAAWVERMTPRWMKVHLLGDFVKQKDVS